MSSAPAAPGPRPLSAAPDFFFQTWQTEDGLPQNHGTAIVQARDGYLWFGTYNGLARFDGARFVVFAAANTPGMLSSRVTSLYEDHQGTLWVGHDAGELTRMRDGLFAPVTLGTNGPGGSIMAIAEDSVGELWLLADTGRASRVRDGLALPPEPGLTVPSLVRDVSGTLWRVHGGKMRVLGTPAPSLRGVPPENDFIVRACASQDGSVWLAGGERLRRWRPDGGEKDWGPVPWGQHFVTTMMESKSGHLWVGTLDWGLFVLSPDGSVTQFARTNGLAHDWVRSLGQDREGTVWVGTGGGVCAARARRVAMVQAPDLWQGRTVLTLCAGADGTLWAGTEGAGVYRRRGEKWTRFGEREGLTNLFVWSLCEDAKGRLWAGTWGGGLFQLVADRFVRPGGAANENLAVCALHLARDKVLWAGTQRGLLRVENDRMERVGAELIRPDVRAITETPDGTIWFGMSGGGLGRWQNGRVTQFRTLDGLAGDYVWSLLAEPDGTLWIGTFGGGLCRLRGTNFATLGERQGIPNNVICHLFEGSPGQLWMGSYGGILRAPMAELHRCADGLAREVSFFAYGKADGLLSLECSGGMQPAGCRSADGRLWFPTGRGAATVDPGDTRRNALPPPVVIEEVLVDGTPVASGRGPALPERCVIPPGRQRFEFRYAALSFVAPERVRFKCRLEGLETEWVDMGAKRAANFSFLPPGDYTFHVQACNNDGVWNEDGATLRLSVQPHLWQTWWFRVLVGLSAGGAVAGVVRGITRRRYRRKLERLERQRAVEKERARIAKDIHDDLGASLTRISLLSQTARGDLDRPEQVAADLDRIYATARELTQAMDEIVWAVNPHHDSLDSLLTYLGGFAQDFVSAAGVRCRLEVPLQPPPWPVTAEVRHNVFLAFKEAVHNAIRHAGASEVRVLFALEPPGFTLVVQDDGRGFDPAPLLASVGAANAAGGWAAGHRHAGDGLLNMRMRLEEIGGECQITSELHVGTRVKLIVPARGGG